MSIAEIIAIGTELTSGAKLDTNSQWLSLQLAEQGIAVHYHTTVADDMAANVAVLRAAIDRADVVIVTGGLGPTLDDLTREVLAAVAGVELRLDADSLAQITDYFARRQREMPHRNQLQAMFPQGSTPLANPVGTAPGVLMRIARTGQGDCLIAALPGVPSEMFRMFLDHVRPALGSGGTLIRRARIHCFGLGESHTEQLLGDLTARDRDPEIGITASDATITLRIIAHGQTEAECQAKIASARAAIRSRLGEYVFGEEDDDLQTVVVRLLRSLRLSLATSEGGTCGLLAHWLASANPDTVLCSSLVHQPLPAVELSETELRQHTIHAAEQLRETTSASLGLAVSAFVVPETATAANGLAAIALATADGVTCETVIVGGNPAIQRSRIAKQALDLVRRTVD